MEEQDKLLQEVTQREYQYGFFSDIETDIIDIGLSEDVVRMISEKKNEPEFMLEFRLNAIPEMAEDGDARLGFPEDTAY
jgi:Fe-S cluster assembly protein SufB